MIVTPLTARFTEPMTLESGAVLDQFVIAYETYGSLNPHADNAILVCHGLTHSCHAAGRHTAGDPAAGWWDAVIGPGKPIDTDRYFVICSNCLGGCHGSSGPSSINPQTDRPYGLDFPVVTISDMVNSQRRLLERLGITSLYAVIGGCMGGQQALTWMVEYPSMVRHAVVIGATPQSSAHSLALWEVIRTGIMADPGFCGGAYYGGPGPKNGMGLIAMFGMMLWMSPEVMQQKFGRRLKGQRRYSLDGEFEIQTCFRQLFANAAGGFDPNSLLYLTKAVDYFDLPEKGALAELFGRFAGTALLVSYESDWRYSPGEMEGMAEAMRAAGIAVRHETLASPFGHGAFHLDTAGVGRVIAAYLDQN